MRGREKVDGDDEGNVGNGVMKMMGPIANPQFPYSSSLKFFPGEIGSKLSIIDKNLFRKRGSQIRRCCPVYRKSRSDYRE